MILDVIIPTHNRNLMLSRTLRSLQNAMPPAGLTVRITVVDNNSVDDTRATVKKFAEKVDEHADSGRSPDRNKATRGPRALPVSYVFEARQGRSFALNAGIGATSGDLVGMIDDDEEIDPGWYSSIYRMFSAGGVDFIGGPYVPRWGADRPDWLPMNYLGAIGWIDGGDRIVPFDEEYPGILMGGNAIITRAMFKKVGVYNTSLGRNGTRLLAGEDDEMYQRLLAVGALGFYVPDLIIYHHIPPERLFKGYFRRWCFWRGVSAGVIDRDRRAPVVYLAGIPRYLIGDAARGLRQLFTGTVLKRRTHPSHIFSGELALWDAAGFFYGKHFYRTPASIVKSDSSRSASGLSPNRRSTDFSPPAEQPH